MEYIFFTILLVIILFGVIVTFFGAGKRKLSGEKRKYYLKEMEKIENIDSPSERIMKYDIVLHNVLKDAGYTGTVGDQLKKKPIMIKNLDAVWNLHKLRNKLAHDMETINPSLLEKKSREFEKELKGLL